MKQKKEIKPIILLLVFSILNPLAFAEEQKYKEAFEIAEQKRAEAEKAVSEFEEAKRLYELSPKQEKENAKSNYKEKSKKALIAQIEHFSSEMELLKVEGLDIQEIEVTLSFFAQKKEELEKESASMEEITGIAKELREFWGTKSKEIMQKAYEQKLGEIEKANEKTKEYNENFYEKITSRMDQNSEAKEFLEKGLEELEKSHESVKKATEKARQSTEITEEKIAFLNNAKTVLLLGYELMAQLYYASKEIKEEGTIKDDTKKNILENSNMQEKTRQEIIDYYERQEPEN